MQEDLLVSLSRLLLFEKDTKCGVSLDKKTKEKTWLDMKVRNRRLCTYSSVTPIVGKAQETSLWWKHAEQADIIVEALADYQDQSTGGIVAAALIKLLQEHKEKIVIYTSGGATFDHSFNFVETKRCQRHYILSSHILQFGSPETLATPSSKVIQPILLNLWHGDLL